MKGGKNVVARLSLRFLGAPLIEKDGRPVHLDTRKGVALLAYLAAIGSATRDTLVTLLWSRYGRKQGQAALRRTLSTLRRDLGPESLLTEGDSVRIPESPDVASDILRVRGLLGECAAHHHDPGDVCRSCIPLLSEAAALHRGEFLQGFSLKDSLEFDDWQFFWTEDARLELAKILERLSLCLAAAGDHDGAIASVRRRLGLDPLDEAGHAMVMRHYAWAGNRSAALRQFEECARILELEMQTTPGRKIARLRDAIRDGTGPEPPSFGSLDSGLRDVGEAARDAPDRAAANAPAEWESASAVVLRFAESETEERAFFGEEIIERLHGMVRKSPSGELRAIFGSRADSESNPEMAVRAAFELLDAARVVGIGARAGVASGRMPRHAHTVEGAPANIALARAGHLCERARSGTAIVGEHTYRRTRDAFHYEEAERRGPRTGAQHATYTLLGLAPLPRKTRGHSGPRTKLIGREEELSRLVAAFERSEREGGHIAVVSGDAGIGKSRLIAELHAHVQRLPSNSPGARRLWLEGRCLPPTVPIAYWPFIDMLRELFSQEEAWAARLGGAEVLQPERGEPGAGEQLDAPEALAEALRIARSLVSPSASQPPPPLLSPEQAKKRTFSALSTLFRVLAGSAALVLVFEDLHWADELSLELIGLLVEQLEGLPVFLVCIYRADPEHKSRHIAVEAARKRPGALTEIHLREMARTESERMLESIAARPYLSRQLRELVLDRAGGNPFFLEELADVLVHTGDLPETPATPETAQSGLFGAGVSAPGVPESVKAVILSRFDRLPRAHKERLRVAATIGRVFSVRLLEEATGEEDLRDALDDLEDRGMVFVERTLPQLEYSFKHVLTQEAIYEDLAATGRKTAHLRVAEAYRRLAGDDPELYCEQLAHHFDHAGESDRAIDFYYRSGERARRFYANEAAIRHFTRGLELIRAAPPESRQLSKELEFLIALGVPLVLVRGHYSVEVETAYLRAKEIAERIGTSDQLFQVMLGLRRLEFARGEHRRATGSGEAMLELGRGAHDNALTARAHMMLGESLAALGRFTEVLEHSKAGAKLCPPEEYRDHLLAFGNDTGVGCRLYEAIALWHLGFPDRARRTVDAAVARAREESHAFTLVFALYHAALVAYMRREPGRVVQLASEQIEVARHERFPLYTGFGPVLIGWALGVLGEGERGIAMIPESFENLPHYKPFGSLFACMRAELYWRLGRIEEALGALEAGFAAVRTCDAHLWEPELSRLRAEIGAKVGEAKVDAERRLERALRIAHGQRACSLELRAVMTLCRLDEDSGESSNALRRLGEIYDGFAEGFDTADLIEAGRMLGRTPGTAASTDSQRD